MGKKPEAPEGQSLPDRVRKSLANLRNAKQSLDAADDALGVLIPEAEQLLSSLNPGARVWVELDHDGPPDWTEQLSLERSDRDRWRLYIGKGYVTDEGWEHHVLLKDSPRENRAAALAKLPDLIDKAAKDVIDAAEERLNIHKDVVQVLNILKEGVK